VGRKSNLASAMKANRRAVDGATLIPKMSGIV
jgi:hypothetical protein